MEAISPLRSQLESLLLVVDTPVRISALARLLEADSPDVAAVLAEIAAEFDARGSGFELRENEEGWRLYTRQANAAIVEKLLLDGSQTRLSRAALETLAVVAYRQPVTRAAIAAVRGVNVDGVIRTLTQRGLIKEVPTKEGPAHYYATTELFLEQLGIDSLDCLPDLAPLLPELDSIEEEF